MSAEKKPVPLPIAELLQSAISTHLVASVSCIGQAREVMRLEDQALDGKGSPKDVLLAGLATVRSIHEHEAGTHAAALTGILCALAQLAALGLDVDGLVEWYQQEAERADMMKQRQTH